MKNLIYGQMSSNSSNQWQMCMYFKANATYFYITVCSALYVQSYGKPQSKY